MHYLVCRRLDSRLGISRLAKYNGRRIGLARKLPSDLDVRGRGLWVVWHDADRSHKNIIVEDQSTGNTRKTANQEIKIKLKSIRT